RIDRSRRRVFRSADRIDLTDDIDPQSFERDEIWNVGIEAAGRSQSLAKIHVVVMIHHLVAGQRLVGIAMREGERGIVGGLSGVSARIEEHRHVLQASGPRAVKSKISLALRLVLMVGLADAERK